jgi:hypothetical protein
LSVCVASDYRLDKNPCRASSTRVDLIGASLPRSGHHLLLNLLTVALGERLKYCASNTDNLCCTQAVCVRDLRGHVFYRKSHDYDLSLPNHLDIPGITYLVQHRDPRGRILSAATLIRRRLLAREDRTWPGNQDQLLWWLAQEAAYTVRFYKKWMESPGSNYMIVAYEDLLREPEDVIERILACNGMTVSAATLAAVKEKAGLQAEPFGTAQTAVHAPKSRTDESIIPGELLGNYELLVTKRCPEAGWPCETSDRRVDPMFSELYRKAVFLPSASKDVAEAWVGENLLTTNPWFLRELASRLRQLKCLDAEFEVLSALAARRFDKENVIARLANVATTLKSKPSASSWEHVPD